LYLTLFLTSAEYDDKTSELVLLGTVGPQTDSHSSAERHTTKAWFNSACTACNERLRMLPITSCDKHEPKKIEKKKSQGLVLMSLFLSASFNFLMDYAGFTDVCFVEMF